MIGLNIAAAALLLAGFLIMAANALGRPRGVAAPWRRRGIDPHLWGFHLLGMGLVFELLTFLLKDPGWNALGLPGRGIVVLALAWVAAAGWLALAALAAPVRGRRHALIPPPNTRARSWPPAYRFFLGTGFASLLVLALLVITTP